VRIIITGATGFIGRHLVKEALNRGHQVVAVVRDLSRAKQFEWFGKVSFIQADLLVDFQPVVSEISQSDALIHLAWSGLPNYQGSFHIFQNLISDISFLKSSIENGLSHLVVAGTCLEYGLQSGALTEEMDTFPVTPYGYAKDILRKSVEFLQQEHRFIFQWMRFFYMYGEGQNSKSLLSILDHAIDQNAKSFDMSLGTQLRDYLPVEVVVKNICTALEHPEINGVINCSSGAPISVLDLVRHRCQERGSNIELNLGIYPLPQYEPLEFWGVPAKLNSLLNKAGKDLN
jgi:dTDP-6-deoxy-L-talose 4-dehydrogenase (NAD+)